MRYHDWPQRLVDFIDSRRATPFAYGTHDCCLFAAQCVEALTGYNHAENYHYASEAEALALITQFGSLEALVTSFMGAPVHPSQAGRGDVVIAELGEGDTVGVCLGNECAFAAPVGVLLQPRTVARVAWKVT